MIEDKDVLNSLGELNNDELNRVKLLLANEEFNVRLKGFFNDMNLIYAKEVATQQRLFADTVKAIFSPILLPSLFSSYGKVYEDKVRSLWLLSKGLSSGYKF